MSLKNSILILFLISSSLYAYEDCYYVGETVFDFLTDLRNSREIKPFEEYNLDKVYLDSLRTDISNSDCFEGTIDSTLAYLQYFFAVHSAKKHGDFVYYRSMLSGSSAMFEMMVEYIREENDYHFAIDFDNQTRNDLALQFIALQNIIADSLATLHENYDDIEIFLGKTQIYKEMTVVEDLATNAVVTIKIKAPPELYREVEYAEQRQRLKFLDSMDIKLHLTNYNPEINGFTMVIPLVPIQDKKYEISPFDTYAVTINDNYTYRIEHNRKIHQDLVIELADHPWKTIEHIPTEWSKITIPKDLSWSYIDVNSKTTLANYNHYKDELEMDLIAIDRIIVLEIKEQYAVYHKIEEGTNTYELQFGAADKGAYYRWLTPAVPLVFFSAYYLTGLK